MGGRVRGSSSPGVDGGRGGVDHTAEEEDGVGRTVPDTEEERPVGGERRRGGLRLTEAAAATGSLVEGVSAPPTFVADRPFLFCVRDRPTDAVLFLGRVVDAAAAAIDSG